MNWFLLSLLGLGAWYFLKKSGKGLSGIETGLGVKGRPRMGKPKTETERRLTHKRKFGTETLPPRGTGLRRRF